jgi:dihydrofolate synthase/folylpolyglutamate synthase
MPHHDEAIAYLASLDKMGIRMGLDEVRRLLANLGDPHLAYPSLLIGGTNGKGSIAAMTAAVLFRSGLRTGLYTSPHLVDLNERIRVDRRQISHRQLIVAIGEVRKRMKEPVTWFEFVTAMAFLHFAREHIDIAVLEVGMGGRLDATNVTEPVVSVVSNVSLEHQAYLGNRLSQIAGEKGEIIRRGRPCITAAKQPQVVRVLEALCRERQAPLYRLGDDFPVRKNPDGTFHYRGLNRAYPRLVCPLYGRHQYANAGVALAAIEALAGQGYKISDEAIEEGLKETRWEGRLEVLGHEPTVLLDGAHNPAGITTLCRTLQSDFHYRRLIVVFGVLSDKNTARMLPPLCRLAHRLILTEPYIGRALPSRDMLALAKRYHRRVAVVESPREALEAALESAEISDLICITGSLYLVGEIKKAFPFTNDYGKRVQR